MIFERTSSSEVLLGTRPTVATGNSVNVDSAPQPATIINFEVPQGTCDSLTHVFGNATRFPMSPNRTYTPGPASVAELKAVHRALHIDRVVIVQTTIYGTDNTCMLDAIKQFESRARGVAVIDDKTSAATLEEMNSAGVRGIRINLETVGLTDPQIARKHFQAAVEQLRDWPDWHIQIYTRPSIIDAIYDLILDSPVPVSLDHFAGIQASEGMQERGFDRVLNLLSAGKVYVKLTAPELVSRLGPDYPDVAPLAKILCETNLERILWGTHWPHPNSYRDASQPLSKIVPFRQIDDGHVFNLLPLWVPDEIDRKTILVDNPARLYGF